MDGAGILDHSFNTCSGLFRWSNFPKNMEERDQLEIENIQTFLSHIQDYPPPIPDSVIRHILSETGLNTDDIRVIHTMNVACQKFIFDVLQLTSSIARSRVKEDKTTKKKKVDLQVSDLKRALETFDVQINRPEFIVSIPKESKEKKSDQPVTQDEEEED